MPIPYQSLMNSLGYIPDLKYGVNPSLIYILYSSLFFPFTALVGSLNFAVFLCLIIASSHLCHKYGCQVICAIGHALSAAGFVLSSLPHSIIPLYFSHSFLTAFGSSCIQGSGFLIIGLYFKRRRSLAVGIVASAVGVGAICWGPLTQYLLKIMEWRNIFRLIAGLFVLMSFLTLFYDPNVEKSTTSTEENPQVADRRKEISRMFDTSIWRVPLYTIAVLSNMVACFGHHTAQIHVVMILGMFLCLMYFNLSFCISFPFFSFPFLFPSLSFLFLFHPFPFLFPSFSLLILSFSFFLSFCFVFFALL